MNLEFDRSRIAVKDILVFVPSLEGALKDNAGAVIRLNGKLAGQLKDMRFPISNWTDWEILLCCFGAHQGLPDGKRAYYDISIAKLKTSERIFSGLYQPGPFLSRCVFRKYFGQWKIHRQHQPLFCPASSCNQ